MSSSHSQGYASQTSGVSTAEKYCTFWGISPALGLSLVLVRRKGYRDSLVVDDKDGEPSRLPELLALSLVLDLRELLLNVLLELADGVDEGSTGIVDLVHDEDSAAEKSSVLELASELTLAATRRSPYRGKVNPLNTDNLGTSDLFDLLLAEEMGSI